MYIDDAIDAAISLMEADPSRLKVRNAYNVTAMSICPERLTQVIQTHLPDFQISYDIDPVRQGIANSWPNSLDASVAKEEWDFEPKFNLEQMVNEMITNLKEVAYAA